MSKLGAATFLLFFWAVSPVQAQDAGAPTFKMDGQARLMTNFTEYGLTQTDNDPALQGQFLFNWGPQFRVGIWGSNVNYPNSDSHFWLRLNADLRIIFSSNADLIIGFSNHNYFKEDSRNGTVTSLQLSLFTYIIRYEQISNFMRSNEASTSFSFSKTWPVWTDWEWENTAGYLMSGAPRVPNYFWIDTGLGIKPGMIRYQGALSYNTASSAVNGGGQPSFALKAILNF